MIVTFEIINILKTKKKSSFFFKMRRNDSILSSNNPRFNKIFFSKVFFRENFHENYVFYKTMSVILICGDIQLLYCHMSNLNNLKHERNSKDDYDVMAFGFLLENIKTFSMQLGNTNHLSPR